MRDFHTLKIWQRSHQLTLDVYEATQLFPSEELFGLTSQLRRAVASIPTNIAEGMGRSSVKEQIHFIEIAFGSLCEVLCQLELSCELHYIDEKQLSEAERQVKLLAQMMSGLRNSKNSALR